MIKFPATEIIHRKLVMCIGALLLTAAALNATPIYTSDTHYSGRDGENYVYTLHIHNASSGLSEMDSGKKVTAFTGNAIADSFGFSGGSIGDYWALDSADANKFIASTLTGNGVIDPTARDATADDLYITFSSPFGQLLNNQRIDVESIASGTYMITDAQLPGELGPGDFNSDGKVDMYDFAIFSLDWGKDTAVEPLLNDRTDMDDSGVVNTADLWLFADEWLVGTEIE